MPAAAKQREFKRGYLEIGFPSERFDSAWKLLLASARVYFSNFAFLAILTLIVFLPAKLAIQFISDSLDVPKGGLAAYLTMDLSDLVLSALAVPAAIYGLLERLRAGHAPPLAPSLRCSCSWLPCGPTRLHSNRLMSSRCRRRIPRRRSRTRCGSSSCASPARGKR